jgi:threonine dehydrogenase-like Zn-dependent dehydrogenase
VKQSLGSLRSGEILVEVLFVPIHGSFWLASHPAGLHPRYDEFVEDGGFVFGNGGVGRVLAVAQDCQCIQPGDYVSVMGHLPCENSDCYSCQDLQRYTECEYGESKIVGHGKGAPDGTYAQYCVLPEIACEICFAESERPSEKELMPYMFGFLLADVRNALSRDRATLRSRRILLVGAGYSGHLAAWLLLRNSPEVRIVVADTQEERLESIRRMAPNSISTIRLPQPLKDHDGMDLSDSQDRSWWEKSLGLVASRIADCFGFRRCDLVFDASSGNTTQVWANTRILGPNTTCIPFGFGSDSLLLSKQSLQISGLRILTSRGVGDAENRQAAMELIRDGAADVIYQGMLNGAQRLEGLDQALSFIKSQQKQPGLLRRPPKAYIAPNKFIPE